MDSKTRVRFSASWLASLTLLIVGEATAGYSITDLGAAYPGATSIGNAINNSGVVAGTLTPSLNMTTAEVASPGEAFANVHLAPIGYAGASTATGINNSGQVTGSFYDTNDKTYHSYLTSSGGTTDLGALNYQPNSTTTIKATATLTSGVNDSGEVVGTARLANGTSMAFGGSAGSLGFLPTIGDGRYSQGNGINAGGQIVGTFEQMPGVYNAFYTGKGNTPVSLLTSYTMPGFGLNSYGMAINKAGAVAGYGDFGQGYSHAFLAPAAGTSPGPGKTPVLDLGVLPGYTSSYAYGINSSSDVVGKLDDQGGDPTAFLYVPLKGMVDLRSLLSPVAQLNWTSLTIATSINDGLQITGQGIVDGQLHAFEMTPIPGQNLFTPAIPPVPAPPALILTAIGSAIAAASGRVRRGRSSGRAGA